MCTNLKSDNNSIQVQHRLPVFSQYVQAHVAFQVDIRMVDLLQAFYLRRVMWKVLVDGEIKIKGAPSVHALIRIDRQYEMENIIRIREVCAHGASQGKLREIYSCQG